MKVLNPHAAMRVSAIIFLFFFLFHYICMACVQSEDKLWAIHLPTDRVDDRLCTQSGPQPSCPVSCFRTDPVCGVDGFTYWCGCADAHCSGTTVARLGFCDVGSGENGSFSGQALLLVHIVWLIVIGFAVLFGFS